MMSIINKFIQYKEFIKKIDVILFIKLNYFCGSVVRMDNSKIIPYKNTVIELEEDAKIYICDGDIELGCDLLKKSKEETRLRLRKNAVWSSKEGCKISYGSTIELLESAIFDTGYFTMNSFSTLIAANKITFGKDVMISRNVVIYDSDFHSILDNHGGIRNASKPVVIGNHVWISANVMILRGTDVGNDSVIGARTIVKGIIPSKVICYTLSEFQMKKLNMGWSRKAPYIDDNNYNMQN